MEACQFSHFAPCLFEFGLRFVSHPGHVYLGHSLLLLFVAIQDGEGTIRSSFLGDFLFVFLVIRTAPLQFVLGHYLVN